MASNWLVIMLLWPADPYMGRYGDLLCVLEKWCAEMYCMLTWPVGIQRTLTVPLHSPNGRQMPAVRAVQETVKLSSVMAKLEQGRMTHTAPKASREPTLRGNWYLIALPNENYTKPNICKYCQCTVKVQNQIIGKSLGGYHVPHIPYSP